MPAPQRPPAVLVLAVINFVFGALGLIGSLCAGLAVLLFAGLAGSLPTAPGQPDPVAEVTGLFESIPGYIPFVVVSMVLGVIWAVVLIVAGVGLLRMRRWARVACLVYAVYTILMTVAGSVYNFAVVEPATEKWQAQFLAKMQAGGPGGAGGPAVTPTANPVANGIVTIISAVISMAYAIALLIVLNLSHVRQAFARAGEAPTATDEEDEPGWGRDDPGFYGEEGRRRRRGPDDRFTDPDDRRY